MPTICPGCKTDALYYNVEKRQWHCSECHTWFNPTQAEPVPPASPASKTTPAPPQNPHSLEAVQRARSALGEAKELLVSEKRLMDQGTEASIDFQRMAQDQAFWKRRARRGFWLGLIVGVVAWAVGWGLLLLVRMIV